MPEPATLILLYAIIPMWLSAGIADWWCHRTSHIEITSGTKESLIHLILFLQSGIGLLAGLFLEINALIVALFLILLLMHQFTSIWDLKYTMPRRKISVLEQQVHTVLDAAPFIAVILICILHRDQFIALFTQHEADFSLMVKRQPLSPFYIASILGVAICINLALYIEELYRCMKTTSSTKRMDFL